MSSRPWVRRSLVARLLTLVALPLGAGAAATAVTLSAPEALYAQDDWGVESDDLRAKKIERYKVLINSSAEEGYAFKQLMKTVGKGRDYEKLLEEYQKKVDDNPNEYKWRMLLGHMLKWGNHLDRALAQYEAASKLQETALVYESLAAVHDANKSMDKAIENYEKALSLTTDKDKEQRERILRALGSMALSRRKLDEAREYFKRLVELDSKNIYLRKELAELLIENKLYDEALEQLRAAEKLAGSNVQIRTQLMLDIGEVLEKLGKDQEAIELYRDAAKKVADGNWLRTATEERIIGIYRRNNQLHELARYYESTWKSPDFDQQMILSRLYSELGDDEKALDYVRSAIKARPRDVDARQRLIQLLERTGNTDKVIAAYEDLIKALPDEHRFRFELADLLFRAQKKDEAIATLDKTGKAFPKNADVHSKLADKYLTWDLRDKALAEFELLVKLEPNNPSHLENLGEFQFQAGKRDDAIATWKKVLKIGGDPADAHMTLGRIYADHAMIDEAIAEFLLAGEKDPQNLGVQRALGEVYERGRRFNDAIKVWEALLTRSDDKMLRREARQHIINILHQQQTLRASLHQYERRFEGTPPDLEAGYFLSEAHLKLKDLEAAATVLEKILQAQPDDLEALLALEKAYSDLGQYERSIAVLERLADVDASRSRVYFQKIADSYLKLGDPDSAEEWMVATLEVNANDSRSYAKLGDVYRKKRQFEKAAEMYEEAIQVDNRAYDHYFVLAEIYEHLHRDVEADKLLRVVVMNAIDENMVQTAARRTIDFNQFHGTLASLETDLQPLMHKTPHRPVYNEIMLELYVAMTQGPLARARSGAPEKRQEARAELEDIGRRAIKPLLDALTDDNGAAQLLALDLLGEIANPNASMQLAVLVDNPNPKLNLRAALALARIRDDRAVDPLAKVSLVPYERRIRELATWGLGRTGSERAIPILEQRATENLQGVRALATLGLGRLQGGVDTVRQRLRDDAAAPVREAAAWALGNLGDTASVDLLIDTLREDEKRVAAMAAWSLGKLGDPRAVEPLLDAYWGSAPEVREAAGFALQLLASGQRLPNDRFSLWEENAGFIDLESTDGGFNINGLLHELYATETRSLTTSNAQIATAYQAQLARTAGRWLKADDTSRITAVLRDLDGTSGSLALATDTEDERPSDPALQRVVVELAPTLRELLRSTIVEHRWHAASLLGKAQDASAVDALVQLLEKDPDADVRRKAALALGHIGDRAAYAPLFASLKDDYFGVRAHAAWGLGLLGDSAAFEALVALLDDNYAYTAAMAARALGLLGDPRAVPELERRFDKAPPSVKRELDRALARLGARAASQP